jgi:hypothetical protein
LVTAATLPLALGLSCDLYVVCQRIFSSSAIGLGIAAGAMTGFAALWYVYPIVVRGRAARIVGKGFCGARHEAD